MIPLSWTVISTAAVVWSGYSWGPVGVWITVTIALLAALPLAYYDFRRL